MQNVSKSGVFVRSEEIPVRGETVKLTFARSFGDWVTVQGEVRWTTQHLDVDRPVRPGFGLRIAEPPAEFKAFYRELFEGDPEDA